MDATTFDIGMFKAAIPEQQYTICPPRLPFDVPTYLITVDLDEDELETEAELTGYLVKIHGLSAKVPFKKSMKTRIHPFRTKDKQTLIIRKIERMFDTHRLR